MVHSELPTTISSRRKKDPDVTPLPPLSPDLIWSFVSGKETSKFFDVDSIESADTTSEPRNLPNLPLASKLAEPNSNGVDPMKRLSSPDKSVSSPGGKSPRG